jgi:hypothetical protein
MVHSGVFSGTGAGNGAIYHFGIGEINWTTGQTDIYCMLCNVTAPTQTWSHYSDVTDQLTAAGNYVLGGNALAPTTVVMSALVGQYGAAAEAFTASTFSAYYAIVQHTTTSTTATNPLLSYHDLGGVQAVVNGTLTLNWGAAGVFTNTVAADA